MSQGPDTKHPRVQTALDSHHSRHMSHDNRTVATTHHISFIDLAVCFELFLLQDWHLSNGDFLSGVSPTFSVSMMSSMANLVTKAMKDFHSKADQRLVLMEALKFCVSC